jgi:hypothetical protein|tara:strand:- start:1755 stop:1880 length:126 start_codon:yes stop_codon:yes gene_type:complete
MMSLETWQECNLERLYEEFLEEGHSEEAAKKLAWKKFREER